MSVTPDPTLLAVIARLKSAVALAEQWTRGDSSLDVVGVDGKYPSLAKLSKLAQDQIAQLITNPLLRNVVLKTYRGNVLPSSGTTRINLANIAPSITAGMQLWSATVTPTSVDAVLSIDFSTFVKNSSASGNIILTLYKDHTLLAYCVVSGGGSGGLLGGAGITQGLARVSVNDPVDSLKPVTYSCRIGADTGTWYQGRTDVATLGGVGMAGWTIDEVIA